MTITKQDTVFGQATPEYARCPMSRIAWPTTYDYYEWLEQDFEAYQEQYGPHISPYDTNTIDAEYEELPY